jgi:DNA-binding MarR family transcriptional regulator
MAEWRVLVELGERSPRTLWQLVESIHADKAQLSRASASLLKKGFVRREPDPQDARSVLFSITPEGLAQKNAVMPTRRAFNQMLMEQLSEEEHLALSSALDTLTDFLNTDPKSL